jgi:hypothetical protein
MWTRQMLTLWAGRLPDAELYKFGKVQEDPKAKAAVKPKPKGPKDEPEIIEEKYEEVNPSEMASLELPEGRQYCEFPIIYNHSAMNAKALENLPAPDFPDPQSLPIPEPELWQILKRLNPKKRSKEVHNFELLTPKGLIVKEEIVEAMLESEFKDANLDLAAKLEILTLEYSEKESEIEAANEKAKIEAAELEENLLLQKQQRAQEDGDSDAGSDLEKSPFDKDLSQSDVQHVNDDDKEPFGDEKDGLDLTPVKEKVHPELEAIQVKIDQLRFDMEELVRTRRGDLMARNEVDFDMDALESRARWIVPANKSIYIVIRFFSKGVGEFNTTSDFDTTFSIGKPFPYRINAFCNFPEINPNPTNIFSNRRRIRAAAMPESLISRAFVLSESVFDFGPLLIGKKADDKNEDSVKQMNSSVFRITNAGKYKCFIEFDLSSTIHADNPEYKKDVFLIEPNNFTLDMDETGEIRVWALPDQDQKFKDDLICMVKDNPTPMIIPMTCLGARPMVEINVSEEGEMHKVEFERLLLNQSANRH